MGYFNSIYVYDGDCTYCDNITIPGHYNITSDDTYTVIKTINRLPKHVKKKRSYLYHTDIECICLS